MTALAALIQSVECPWVCRVGGKVRGSSLHDADEMWRREVFDQTGYSEDLRKAYWGRIAASVQIDQLENGIPIRTVQEAIDAGEYAFLAV